MAKHLKVPSEMFDWVLNKSHFGMSICQTLSVELAATSLLPSISCLHCKREGIRRTVAQWDSASTEKWKVTGSVLTDALGRTLRPILVISQQTYNVMTALR